MKQPMSEYQKAEFRLEALKIAARRDEIRGVRKDAPALIEDADKYAAFLLED